MRLAACSALAALATSLAACGTGADPPGVMAGYDATWRTGDFALAAGADETWCTYLRGANETDVDVSRLHVEQTEGGHHVIVYTVDHAIDLPPQRCPQGGQFGWVQIVTSQDPTMDVEFPAGVGYHLQPHQQFVVETHYINATDHGETARASFSVRYAASGTVKDRAASFLIGTTNIEIAAGATLSAEATCSLPDEISALRVVGHQHRFGTGVTVDHIADGAGAPSRIYAAPQWESPPPVLFSPAMPIGLKDQLRVHCDWENTSAAQVWYPHEMCFAIGMYYPARGTLVCVTAGGRDKCVCFYQGLTSTGGGGAVVRTHVRRSTTVTGVKGDPTAGRPIFCSLFRAQDWTGSKMVPPYYHASIEDVKLPDEQTEAVLTFADVTPGDYRALCYMDTVAGGLIPGSGSPVSLFPPSVTAVAGQPVDVDVLLDNAVP